MSTNKKLFEEAIADAKSVRDAAVANAKAALEETFTPRIMSMLEKKLNDMDEDLDEVKEKEEEGYGMEKEGHEAEISYGAAMQKPAIEGRDLEEDSYEEGAKSMEEMDLEEILAELEKEEGKKEEGKKQDMEEAAGKATFTVPANDADDMDDEAKHFKSLLKKAGISATVEAGIGELEVTVASSDKSKAKKAIEDAGYTLGEAKETEEEGKKKVEEAKDKMEEAEDDDEVTELTVDELKDIIRDVLQDVMGGEETSDETGDESGDAGSEEKKDDDESIDLDELLAELDSMEEGKDKEKVEEKKEKDGEKVEEAKKEAKKAKEDLEEAIKVIKFLKKELNEVNLLNAKNTYVNKIFKAKSLSESQKVTVLKTMDKATNVKEAKVIYESLVSTLSTVKKNPIKESVGFASKAAGVAPKQPIVESDTAIRRMQQLAGIIK